jgi:protein phosphatase
MDRVELRWGAATDVGQVRQVNEDSLVAQPPVFAVADGMGGHSGGDVASAIVAEELATLADRWLGPEEGAAAVVDALARCQERILGFAREQRAGGAPEWYAGTTAVVALLVQDDSGPSWLVANLGDSRVYRLRDEELEQVTVDHSLVQQLLDAGVITEAEVAVHPERHVVTRALGGPDDVHPELFRMPVSTAPRLLVCSDGVTNMLSDERLTELLVAEPDPARAAELVVAAAVEAGGHDNATAVVVDVVGWAP